MSPSTKIQDDDPGSGEYALRAVASPLCVELEPPREDSMSDKFDRRDFLRVERISNWVPAQRVLSVEAVMDVERAILWPDSDGKQPVENDNVVARAQEGRRTRR